MLVNSFDTFNQWGKAGLMIRGSRDASSKYFGIFMTQDGNSAHVQWRNVTNGSTSIYNTGRKERTLWLRINKVGNEFRSYTRSSVNDNWEQAGDMVALTFDSPFFTVGVAVTSHDNSKLSSLFGSNLIVSNQGGACFNYASTDIGQVGERGDGGLHIDSPTLDFYVSGSGAGELVISFCIVSTAHGLAQFYFFAH